VCVLPCVVIRDLYFVCAEFHIEEFFFLSQFS
jgi:hypothetical protein